MDKRIRQYMGLFFAIVVYYIVHEGAHLMYALFTGVFKQINFMGIGIQIDVYADKMSEMQLGMFCLVGSIATMIVAYVLVLLTNKIVKNNSKVFKASMYYITVTLLLLDPIYLSVFYRFFGGGDMNGISLLVPEVIVQILYGILFVINMFLFWKNILPKYKVAFLNEG